MTKRRKTFTEEFKADAVRMYRESSAALSDVARQLGVSPSMLSRWHKEREAKEKRPAGAPPAEDKSETARLRRELELVKQERDFLKKAAAFFAKEHS